MKQTSPKSVHTFLNLGLFAKVLADKKFPEECFERALLLEIEEAFTLLWEFHYSMERTRDKVERIRAITTPPDAEVFHLSRDLMEMVANVEKETEATKVIRRASEVLDIWYDLYLNLNQLFEANEAMRFGLNPPEGNG